jgi:ParB family chromosome partitioning protein
VNPEGHLELRWAVDAIRVGSRARQDVGDLTGLVDSIRQHGLLQPLTLSPDGVLLCGARRLAALRHLGIKQVQVWVRDGLSTRLQRLFAEQDENTLHQPLRPTEAAALYRDLKQLLIEDAARRQEATRYGANPTDLGEASGDAKLASPANGPVSGDANLASPARGATRAQAARLVTGSKSYTTLERVDELRRIADDPRQSDATREAARVALDRMDQDGKVWGHYRQAKAIQATSQADDPEMQALALQARTRAGVFASSQHTHDPGPSGLNADAVAHSGAGSRREDAAQMRPATLRAFLLFCDELAAWPGRFDPTLIGPALPDDRWAMLRHSIDAGVAFLHTARQARTAAHAANADTPVSQ